MSSDTTPPIGFTEVQRNQLLMLAAPKSNINDFEKVAIHSLLAAYDSMRRQLRFDREALERGTRVAVVGIPPRGY